MASRRDLIQSFQFAARRVVSAVVMRQTDPTEWPNRRLGGAGFGAVMVTVIALAAVGIYGMIVPGGKTSWKDGRSIIVVKETGAPYVYIEGKLHPVLNFTSAALLVGTTTVTLTSSASLAGVPRGVELGIPGAPMTLPKDADLVSPPWSLCSQQVPDVAGKPTSRTRLVVGRNPGQGFRPGDKALLVTDTKEKDQYLIWHDQRYLLRNVEVERIALGLDRGTNVQVGDAWLKALPAGQDIAVRTVTGAGQPSTKMPGTKIGDLVDVKSQDKGTQHYLVDSDGLKSISDLQYQIQLASGAQAKTTSSSDVAKANPAQPPAATATQPPTSVPDLVRGLQSDTVVCAAYRDTSFAPQVLVDSAIPEGGGVPTGGTASDGATTLADRVWVPPGKAALVESLTSPDAKDGPLYLVTDVGRRYAIRSTDVLRFLGLGTAKRISKLPGSLLVRIPEGPPLDPDDARAALQLEKGEN
jgi:type VII secretion protein EccB